MLITTLNPCLMSRFMNWNIRLFFAMMLELSLVWSWEIAPKSNHPQFMLELMNWSSLGLWLAIPGLFLLWHLLFAWGHNSSERLIFFKSPHPFPYYTAAVPFPRILQLFGHFYDRFLVSDSEVHFHNFVLPPCRPWMIELSSASSVSLMPSDKISRG